MEACGKDRQITSIFSWKQDEANVCSPRGGINRPTMYTFSLFFGYHHVGCERFHKKMKIFLTWNVGRTCTRESVFFAAKTSAFMAF